MTLMIPNSSFEYTALIWKIEIKKYRKYYEE
jgi:hypothetical protein